MAFVSCLAVMVVLKLMQRIVHVKTYKRLEVQFIHRTETLNDIKELFGKKHVTILDQDKYCGRPQPVYERVHPDAARHDVVPGTDHGPVRASQRQDGPDQERLI